MSNKNAVKKKDVNIKDEKKSDNKKVDKLREIAEDENVSVIKRAGVLIGVMLIAFALVMAGIKIYFDLKYKMNKKDISVLGKSKEYGLMLEAMNTLDNYVDFDQDMKEAVEKNAKYSVKNYDYSLMDSEKLAGILLSDKYLNLGKYDKLMDEMKEYYDDNTNLINNKKIEGADKLDKEAMAANTVTIAYVLRRYDDVFDDIDIYKGLADFFNEKIEAEDSSDYVDVLREIFFFMYEENKQSMLKTDKFDSMQKAYFENCKSKIDSYSMLYTINDVMLAKRLSEYRQFFYNDLEYADCAQELYEDINNEGGYMIDTYGISYMYALNSALFSVSDIESGKYFIANIGETFNEYYEKYLDY